jgi:hypothetical protein
VDRLDDQAFELLPQGSARAIDSPPSDERSFPAWTVFAILALVALLLAAIPAAKLVRRRLTLARAHGPGERVLAAFEVMALQASDLGLGRGPAETMNEYRARLKERVSALDGDLDRLTRLASAAAYSPDDLTSRDAGLAVSSARRVAVDIRKAAGPGSWIIGWFRPAGLRPER